MIAITNDDGIESEGIGLLIDAVEEEFGEESVYVVAPRDDCSGAGASLSLGKRIVARKVGERRYVVHGTPADAAYLAVHGGFMPKPKMLISGVNLGSNLSDDVYFSGTVGAAAQGRFLERIPMAFSLASVSSYNLPSAANVAARITRHFYDANWQPGGLFFNVNLPDLPEHEVKGWRASRLGRREEPGACEVYDEGLLRGGTSGAFRIGGRGALYAASGGEDSDFQLLRHGYATITPLSLDLTSYSAAEIISRGDYLAR